MIKKSIINKIFMFSKLIISVIIISLFGCSFMPKPKPVAKPELPKVVMKQPKPPIPETKKLVITFMPSNDLNSMHGKSYKLKVTVYQLKSAYNFKARDYRAITENEKQVLKEDLIEKEELRFSPGQPAKSYVFQDLNPDTRYIGFVAHYMDINHATWQVTYKISKNNNSKILVSLTNKKILLNME